MHPLGSVGWPAALARPAQKNKTQPSKASNFLDDNFLSKKDMALCADNATCEYWPEYANYSPIARPWREILADSNRLLRFSNIHDPAKHSCPVHCTTDYHPTSASWLEALDNNFSELFFEGIVKRLIYLGYPFVFRLAQSCKW
jgi:hypothetical protein